MSVCGMSVGVSRPPADGDACMSKRKGSEAERKRTRRVSSTQRHRTSKHGTHVRAEAIATIKTKNSA